MDNGYCTFGERCKYAHDEFELRDIRDPIPSEAEDLYDYGSDSESDDYLQGFGKNTGNN
jgi:hypothetical protein